MSAAVRVFQSTDEGAPTLRGEVGALIEVLDACLVTGYGIKTLASLARSGATATATVDAGHGFTALGGVGPVIRIEGADQAEYNGDHRIAITSATQFTFPVSGSPASPATGTVTAKRAPLGWEKAFSETNKAAYRPLDPTASGMYLRVQDDAPHGSALAREARMRGYEEMTDIDTGDGLFPTEAQSSAGVICRKSTTANATARPWMLVANTKILYLLVDTGDATNNFLGFSFGDIVDHNATHPYHAVIVGSSENSWSSNQFHSLTSSTNITIIAHYIARDSAGTGGSVAFGKISDRRGNQSLMGGGQLTYPHPGNNALWLAPVLITHNNTYRGRLPGLWNPLHLRPLSHLDTFQGQGMFAGKTFIAINTTGPGNGQVMLEISDTWD